jgi:hypothetical protein
MNAGRGRARKHILVTEKVWYISVPNKTEKENRWIGPAMFVSQAVMTENVSCAILSNFVMDDERGW